MALEPNIIHQIVTDFYKKATVDFLIGYHFRKIAEFDGDNPLAPPIEAFESHIPRIVSFWELQLNGKMTNTSEQPFNLIKVHEYLKIRKGEIGRWVTLFNETLNEYVSKNDLSDEQLSAIKTWSERVQLFEEKFLSSKVLFPG